MDYATTAERYWRTHLPSQVATMEDPTAFFADLGQQVQDQIEAGIAEGTEIAERLLPPEPTYEQLKAMHYRVAKAAQESALEHLVFLPPEPGTEDLRPESAPPLPGAEAIAAQE